MASQQGAPPTTTSALDNTLPLVVDLDGTLLRTDLLFECLVGLMRSQPWLLFLLPVWLWRGRAYLKRRLAELAPPEIETLPVQTAFLEWLRGLAGNGQRLYLYSAADDSLVRAVAERFGIFAECCGSDGRTNGSGRAKLAAIRARFGDHFAYAGNGADDVVILRAARAAVLVGAVARVRDRLAAGPEAAPPVIAEFAVPAAGALVWMRALRLHQWAKNALLLVPWLLSPYLTDRAALIAVGLGALSFGLLASTTYLLNDLLDLGDDRRHRSKARRPLAAGEIPLVQALIAVPVLAAGTALSLALHPRAFLAAVFAYGILTIAYSFWIKRIACLDLMALALLFTLRIVGGLILIKEPMSPWLLSFSMFFFLSLAAIKRYGEWRLLAEGLHDTILRRGYQLEDGPWLVAMGAASGFCSILVLLIYLLDEHFPKLLFQEPGWLWLGGMILLYWLSRCWLLAVRGRMQDDPVVFALKDPVSRALGVLAVAAIVLMRYTPTP